MSVQRQADVMFRGEQRGLSFEYEGDGVIVWCFDGENTCHGEDATELEQQEVYDQLWTWMTEYWEWCNDAD